MDIVLTAKKRELNIRPSRLRMAGWVLGSVYGKGRETVDIQLPYLALKDFLIKRIHKLKLKIEDGEALMVGVEEVQKGYLGDRLEHISFKVIRDDEEATLTVDIRLEGQAAGQKQGGVVNHLLHKVDVRGFPQNIPDFLTVNIEELKIGGHIQVQDIPIKGNFAFLKADLDRAVVKCQAATIIEEKAPEVAAAADGAEKAADGEEKAESKPEAKSDKSGT